ncbi:MAG TPA: hypothetical protein VFN10_11705 [Thermoanaerobaculia bacterium]|nr:hypothetical protein [Thermoanaerobaculia bacterium]
MPTEKTATFKVQTTLKGYSAWAFRKLKEGRAEPSADVAKELIDSWIRSNAEVLEAWGITPAAYRREGGGGDVVKIRPDVPTDRSEKG